MTDNQSVKDRLKIYIKYLGIGQSKFEKQCNLSNGYINNSTFNSFLKKTKKTSHI